MTKILERAFERARRLPVGRQDEVATMILNLVEQEESDLRLTPGQQDEVRRRLANPEPVVPESR